MTLLRLLPLVLLLASCEGRTSMTHTFWNGTSDTLRFTARFDALPWNDSIAVTLPPEGGMTLYTFDMRGKCSDCAEFGYPTRWVDTLELAGRNWAQYPGPAAWYTEVSEGRTWIEFNHTLHIGIGMVE